MRLSGKITCYRLPNGQIKVGGRWGQCQPQGSENMPKVPVQDETLSTEVADAGETGIHMGVSVADPCSWQWLMAKFASNS